MFSIKEAKFILENASRDLKTVEERIEDVNRSLAEDAKRLGTFIEARDKLKGIVSKIETALKEAAEEEEDQE